MTLPDPELGDAARTTLQRFRIAFEPLRPELFRFCRHLTRTAWDAEDLVQDTLARAFVVLGSQYGHHGTLIETPRAWLFRVASNLWIDRMRHAAKAPVLLEPPAHAVDPQALREAAGSLIARLSPQERVAVVLADAFDLPNADIAVALGTTVGAVKAALSRARGKLTDDVHEPTRVPTPAVLDAFRTAFNAGDVPALTSVLLDAVLVELPGVAIDLGVAVTMDPANGILHHMVLQPISAGVIGRFLTDYRPDVRARFELREHRSEHLGLVWYAHTDGDAIRCFVRFELDATGTRIAHVRAHYYSPEALAEVAGELDVPYRSNGYGTEMP